LDELRNRVTASKDALAEELDKIISEMASLERDIEQAKSSTEGQGDDLVARKDALDVEFIKLKTSFVAEDQKLEKINTKGAEIVAGVKVSEERIRKLEAQISNAREKYGLTEQERATRLERAKTDLKTLEERMNTLTNAISTKASQRYGAPKAGDGGDAEPESLIPVAEANRLDAVIDALSKEQNSTQEKITKTKATIKLDATPTSQEEFVKQQSELAQALLAHEKILSAINAEFSEFTESLGSTESGFEFIGSVVFLSQIGLLVATGAAVTIAASKGAMWPKNRTDDVLAAWRSHPLGLADSHRNALLQSHNPLTRAQLLSLFKQKPARDQTSSSASIVRVLTRRQLCGLFTRHEFSDFRSKLGFK
jgi:hypothetical protein